MSRHGKWVVLALFLALAVRSYNLNVPFVERFNAISRLSNCASVARNFYEHGFNFFYPEIDENGAGPYLLNAEMPTYAYLMALAYKLTGGVHEWAARSVSVVLSLAALWLLYLLVRKKAGESAALFAMVFAALSPMNVALARSIQCDMTMVFAGTAALYFFIRYGETQRRGHFVLSAFSMALAVGTKIYALYLFIPVIYLAWEREGWSLLRRPRNYFYCLLVSLTFIWYFYMWKIGHEQKLAYSTFGYPDVPGQWTVPVKALFLHALTPIGAVLLAFGIFRKTFKEHRFAWIWLGSVVLYLIVMWPMVEMHPYYLLPAIPPLAYFVGLGGERLLAIASFPMFRSPRLWLPVLALELLFCSYYYRLLYFIPPDRMAIVEGGKAVDALIPKDSLVIASWGESPIQLYYCHRRGWQFGLDRPDDGKLIESLEAKRKEGAGYFMSTTLDKLHALPSFERYLRSRYPVVKESAALIVFDLKAGPR